MTAANVAGHLWVDEIKMNMQMSGGVVKFQKLAGHLLPIEIPGTIFALLRFGMSKFIRINLGHFDSKYLSD